MSQARQRAPEYTVIFMDSIMPPLDGLLVLDLSRVLAGPYCTMQLGDLGARVIKIEQPGRGDDTRAWGPPFVGRETASFLSVNRNKESLALDLKHPAPPALLTYQSSIAFPTGGTPAGMGNRRPSIAPYDTFAAADGDFVLSVGNDDQFHRLARVLGRADLAADPRFATNADRVINYGALSRELSPALAALTRRGLLIMLTAPGCPGGALRRLTEALGDQQLAARDMIVPLEPLTAGPIRVLGTPLKLSGTPAAIRMPPPALGQHTRAILANDVGLKGSEIESLLHAGVIG